MFNLPFIYFSILILVFFFFFKQKTAYEMRISDWSSDVCSSDLQFDQQIVDARVEEFRDQVKRRIAGHMTEDQFKPLRLKNGLYLQLHAYMLRIAIPYGTLNPAQVRMLAHVARTYDRGYGHFTTRQNMQFHWTKLDQTPDILPDFAKVQLHAIQTSGESIRNISADQYAGAAADEIADPRPWAELLRQEIGRAHV